MLLERWQHCHASHCLTPRYMSINTAIELLLEIEQKRGQAAYDDQTTCVGIARLGADDQQIIAGSMQQLKDVDFGPPLHCLIIAGR